MSLLKHKHNFTNVITAGLVAGGLCVLPLQGQSTARIAAPITIHAPNVGPAPITIPAPLPARPEPPKPFAKFSASMLAIRDSLVDFTRRQMGIRYRRGADSPDRGFDCSGLVKYVMAHFNIELPRRAKEQALVGQRIERNIDALKPGDLLTFGRGKRISHIGIYVGNGKYVHAPTPGARVREGSLFNTKSRWWKGARRVLAASDTTTTRDSTAN